MGQKKGLAGNGRLIISSFHLSISNLFQGHKFKVITVPSWPFMALNTEKKSGELKITGMFAELWLELQVSNTLKRCSFDVVKS